MSQLISIAASLPPAARPGLAIEVISKNEPISHLAVQHQVIRKFLCQQGQKASVALNVALSAAQDEQKVLFYLSLTQHHAKSPMRKQAIQFVCTSCLTRTAIHQLSSGYLKAPLYSNILLI